MGGMMPAGDLPHKIFFRRATVTQDGFGSSVESWADLTRAWVAVKHSTGSERRDAAALQAVQSATFIANTTATLRTVTVKDRIRWRNQDWDIHSIIDQGVDTIEFTATVRKG